MPCGDIHGQVDVAGFGIDHSGRADHHAAQPTGGHARLAKRGAQRTADIGDQIIGIAGCGRLSARDAGEVGHRRGDAVRADVNPCREPGRADDTVERGVRSSGAGLRSHDFDQAACFQATKQLRGGHLGQAGAGTDLGARQRPRGQQQIQSGAVVHRPQQAGRAGLRHRVPPMRLADSVNDPCY
jgi:hypothetical protein